MEFSDYFVDYIIHELAIISGKLKKDEEIILYTKKRLLKLRTEILKEIEDAKL